MEKWEIFKKKEKKLQGRNKKSKPEILSKMQNKKNKKIFFPFLLSRD
jgi:hypothetical protein